LFALVTTTVIGFWGLLVCGISKGFFGRRLDVKTYFLIIRAMPSAKNHNALTVPSVEAHFWVLERSTQGALRRARYYLKQSDWIPGEVELPPVPISALEHRPSATESDHFRQAQRHGIAMFLK
jgi:hypothetical protein